MSDEFEAIHELDKVREENPVPSEARDLSDEEMLGKASNVTAEEFLAFTEQVNKTAEEISNRPAFTKRDIIRDSIFFVFAVAGAFGWLMLMLLIISFVSMGYLHFNIQYMIVASIVFAVVIGIVYTLLTVRKYNKRIQKKREDMNSANK